MTKYTTSRGSAMVNILMALAVVSVLSVASLWGYRVAMYKRAVADLSDLVTKSVAGVVTSGVLEGMEATDEEKLETLLKIDSSLQEQLPLDIYISDIAKVNPNSEYARHYGSESFVGPMKTVVSSYALKGGHGIVVLLNQIDPDVCELLLDSKMEYEAVWNLHVNNDVIYRREQMSDKRLINKVCVPIPENNAGIGEVADVGLIFQNTARSLPKLPEGTCNSQCTTEVLGYCVYTKEMPCKGDGCDRKYFDFTKCEWFCHDTNSIGDACECPADRPVWDGEQKMCLCNQQADCQANEVCLTDEDASDERKKCIACPRNFIGTKEEKCVCPAATGHFIDDDGNCICLSEGQAGNDLQTCCTPLLKSPVSSGDAIRHCCPEGTWWDDVENDCISCYNEGRQWSADKPCCFGLDALSSSTKEEDKRCCPNNTYWDGFNCTARPGVECDANNPSDCKECDASNAAEKCPAKNQYCDLTTNTCKFCEYACGGKVSEDKLSCSGSNCTANQVCVAHQIGSDCCYQEVGTYSCLNVQNVSWNSLPACTTTGTTNKICRITGTYNKGKYMVSDITMTYPAALAWCQSYGWHLATREEACLKKDTGVNDGWNCYNMKGLFPTKTTGMNEHLWMDTTRSEGATTCCNQLSITNSCSDNHATSASAKLYALCAPGLLPTNRASCGLGYYAHSTSGCLTCTAGYFCYGDPDQNPCVAGYYCPAGTSMPTACPAGTYQPKTLQSAVSACLACPAGDYCPQASVKTQKCPAGSYCPTPAEKIECPAGSYCPEGATDDVPCPQGTYQPLVGQTSANACIPCSNGEFCPAGTSEIQKCPEDYYCPNASDMVVCPAGHYCPAEATAPIMCPAGTYAKSGSHTCSICTDGTYCQEGSSEPTDCPAGSYCPTPAEKIECPTGAYCPRRSTEKTLCSAGTYQPDNGAKYKWQCLPCPTGAYCPVGSAAPTACPDGTYQPLTERSSKTQCRRCSSGSYCPSGSDTQADCPEGYYCPTPATKIDCPDNANCPAGSVEPAYPLKPAIPKNEEIIPSDDEDIPVVEETEEDTIDEQDVDFSASDEQPWRMM